MKFSKHLKTIKTKYLNSNKGASIILSLVIFLAAAMVSLVIVNAALTNAQRIRTQKNHEQDYLMLSSSAAMLENMMVGCGVSTESVSERKYDRLKNEYEATKTTQAPTVVFTDSKAVTAKVVPSNIKDQLVKLIEASENDIAPDVGQKVITKKGFSMDIALDAATGVDPVKSDWYLEKNNNFYSIIVVLRTVADEDSKKGKLGYNNIASYQTLSFKIGQPKTKIKTEHTGVNTSDEKLVTTTSKVFYIESCVVNSGLDTENEEIKNNY